MTPKISQGNSRATHRTSAMPRTAIYYWLSGSAGVEIDGSNRPGVLLAFQDWTISWHGLTRIPNSVASLVGTINNATLDCGIKGIGTFASGTVLYRGGEIERQYIRNGIDTYDISLRFQVRENGGNGWNYFPRMKGGALSWEQVHYKDGSAYTAQDIYEGADLSVLL